MQDCHALFYAILAYKKEGSILEKRRHDVHFPHKHRKSNVWKIILGAAIFVVLVAVVAGLIFVVSKSGQLRLSKQSDVAAVVNGESITTAYLDEQYARVPDMYRAYITKSVLLNQTINEVLLLQEAKKNNIAVTAEDVNEEISTAMAAAGVTDDQLDERLAAQNITRKYLEELYTKQLTINALLEAKIFKSLKVTNSEVSEFYDSRIRAMHILVETEKEATGIIASLQKVSAKSLQSTFSKMAKEKSTDPSANVSGGDLGEFSKGMMVPEFEAAAFALEEGEFTTKPVKTQFGYHVILRIAKNETVEEQANSIKEFLLTQKKNAAVPLYLNQLRDKANVKVLFVEEEAEEEE